MAREDYYSILGIDKQAPEREIKRAYYELARDLHPDRAKTPEDSKVNAERLAVISKAYNALKDPTRKAEYDAANKGGGGGGSPPAAPQSISQMSTVKGVPPGNPTPPAAVSTQPAPSMPAASAPRVSSADSSAARIVTAQKSFVKGMEFWKASDHKKALPFFETAVKNDPESEAHYHVKLAICLMKTKGSFSRAVEAMERACAMDAYNVEFKFQLGELYETVGITSKAKKVYEDIIKWEPDNSRAKLKLQDMKNVDAMANPSFLAKLLPSVFGKK